MALLHIEGFDGGGTTIDDVGNGEMIAYLEARYPSMSSGSGNDRIHTQTGWGGTGFSMSWGKNLFSDQNYIDFPVVSQTEIFVGFAVKPKQSTTSAENILEFRDIGVGATHIRVNHRDGATLQFLRNNTQIPGGVIPGVLFGNRWHYVEMRIVFSNSSGIIEVRINGKEVLNITGLDTLDGSSTIIDTVRFRGSDGSADIANQWLLDDVYIVDTSGSDAVGFLGPVKVETLFPTSEGGTIDFTPSTGTDNSALVDENPRNDSTDYNSSADTPSNKDLFGAPNLSVVTGGIIGVQVTNDALLDGAGNIGLQSITFENATQGTGSVVEVSATTEYIAVQHIFENNPDTGSAWAAGEVDAMEFGYEID